MSAAVICACGVCRKDIVEGDEMADHHVYKLGELAYIELAHRECAIVETAEKDLARMLVWRGAPYWDFSFEPRFSDASIGEGR